MRYLPHTETEIREMLDAIGVRSIDELFDVVPEARRLRRPLAIDPGLDEVSLMGHIEELASRSEASKFLSFLGAGAYDHHVPPSVDQLLLRGEFLTAYTPYQPEVSQGTLQAIFEFQTIVSEILGLPISNASMYDGASAAAEAALMARRLTRRSTVVVSNAIHPEYRDVVRTYLAGIPGAAMHVIPFDANGQTDSTALAAALNDDSACVLVGYPNVFGVLENVRAIADLAHSRGALVVTSTPETQALSVAESPGALGADIATGEGQPLGVPVSFGGPGCGLLACGNSREMLQNIPGRLCGQTVDADGKRGFVLTLSAREQHIRREKAASNICTNQGLIALAITIRMSLLGQSGYANLGRLCHSKSEYLKSRLRDAGFTLPYAGPTFNEFVVKRSSGSAAPLLAALAAQKILAGPDLGRWFSDLRDCFLVTVTEKHTRADLDKLCDALTAIG